MSNALDAPLKVLVVEDNPADAALIEETLTFSAGSTVELVYATSLGQALGLLNRLALDVVLLDLGLPDGKGVVCVEQVRLHHRDLPIVVLTGNDEQMAMACIAAGAQDYLCKDRVLSDNVRRAIDYAIARRDAAVQMARSEQLQRENAQMQEVNRAKSQFIASMSHELRTPLNAVIGFGEMLRTGIVMPHSRDYQKCVEHICTSGKHLLNLINDILDMAKIESGKMEFRYERASISALVAEVVDICGTLMREKSISVTVVRDDTLDEFYIDVLRFKQILYNFLSNAIKFTPAGGYASIHTRVDGPDHIRLEVHDSGVGIGSEELPLLFQEFRQVGNNAQSSCQGSGLGLSLTRKLVEAQGGHVGVSSSPGTGSVFYAVLPKWVPPTAAHGAGSRSP
ncbi:response regulator [Duganella sp. FT94W]|uniref:histidine kinase n=1 Tax=Duganella lactea TaxID=2692173 RepID=A0ABW9V5U6_9BURK|nr:ATP-binding protein [Duganella lactea]MYM35059.1 response regulator [Duganella lactea]